MVSTTLGCEGLEVVDGENIMIADSPYEFAERVIMLLTNRDLRERISTNGRQLVKTRYDWTIISKRLIKVYIGLVDQIRGERPA